ncbi:class I SAM-dependent methyltransferase [Falsiroseomonas selenitidurans]|uniref:Class I SAM-dependent methyltransferase n=1 Tax=Falsiroseomonas selenitidurans TaxID=2716335 RepID=A0ABX1DYK0_9PROT|nr:class I SAM-dependent methyltransferase [Falsiroseomonas selenitidurans]NKC29974.1 class I SAM-dependent methyltransferase [Falsiroseomonas selenitidurans]
MAESFDGDWLALREPHDAAARDQGLAALLAAALPARPRVLDLGAGTGSLLRWLAPLIGRAQAWTLVDADGLLLRRAFAETEDFADAFDWPATYATRKTLLVHAPGGAWRVEGLVADLRDAPRGLPLEQVDAVVNTALCDLVSADWVARIAAACAARRLPFYAALNVTGRERFTPPHRGDALVARGFTRDQNRDKGFGGIALGARAPAAIAAAFAAQGYTVHRAPSDWRIPRQDAEMVAQLASGHARAAMGQLRRERSRILDWAMDRRAQAGLMQLAARIGHADLLCLPPKE